VCPSGPGDPPLRAFLTRTISSQSSNYKSANDLPHANTNAAPKSKKPLDDCRRSSLRSPSVSALQLSKSLNPLPHQRRRLFTRFGIPRNPYRPKPEQSFEANHAIRRELLPTKASTAPPRLAAPKQAGTRVTVSPLKHAPNRRAPRGSKAKQISEGRLNSIKNNYSNPPYDFGTSMVQILARERRANRAGKSLRRPNACRSIKTRALNTTHSETTKRRGALRKRKHKSFIRAHDTC